MDGDSLEAALRDYGPAAIEDLLPRLWVIAQALDEAHASGQVHGSLHPQNIFIDDERTRVAGLGPDAVTLSPTPIRPPYTAPEIVSGGAAVPASDQFALAAIAFEWLFGRRVSGPAHRPIDVRTLPGVDRDAMSTAFTRALAPKPADRFASCLAFQQALGAAVIPVLPLGAEDDALAMALLPGQTRPALAGLSADDLAPEAGAPSELLSDDWSASDLSPSDGAPLASVPEVEPEWADPELAAREVGLAEPPFTEFEPKLSPPVEPITSWQPSGAYSPPKAADRFSGGMLIAAALVGMVVGFAAGYMARPRALQFGPLASMASGPSGASRAAGASGAAADTPASDAASPRASAASVARQAPVARTAPEAAAAPNAPAAPGRLLVRSTPSGASVTVDDVARGVTPLTLRDLALGSRTIAVELRGYLAEERRVVLTRARPSRSLEVRLSAAATAPARSGTASATGSSTPAPARPRPASAASGSLTVDSRPAGATVVIDGQPRGVTPLTIDALAPGDHRVSLSLAGYQPFATTVRVVAGERTRAAASLSVQE